MIKAASLNKLKLVRQKAAFFQRMVVYREVKLFSNIISLCFLGEAVIQICLCVFDHKFYPISIDYITS